MPLASDNAFPRLRLTPIAASAVPNPPTGSEYLFCDSADSNKVKRKNAAGGVTLVEGGTGGATGGGDVTTAQLNAVDASAVHLALAETITGVKTFSASPIVPTPTTSTQAATKGYVDTAVGTGAITQATFDAEKALTVHLAGGETITGAKTFSATPTVPTPTAAGHAVTKAYVDARVVSDYTPATIDYDTVTSTYPTRSVATSSPNRKVIWSGPVEPISGGNYAIVGKDVWWKTT